MVSQTEIWCPRVALQTYKCVSMHPQEAVFFLKGVPTLLWFERHSLQFLVLLGCLILSPLFLSHARNKPVTRARVMGTAGWERDKPNARMHQRSLPSLPDADL